MTPAQQLGKDIFYEIYVEIAPKCHNPNEITVRIAEKVIARLSKTPIFKAEMIEYIKTL